MDNTSSHGPKKPTTKKKPPFWKVIISYVFFWPSLRKYATYLYIFRKKKEKDKYDFWK